MHPGSGPGLNPKRLGEKGGTETVTLNTAQIPSHNHSVSVGVNTNPGDEATPTGVIANHSGGFSEEATSGQFLGGTSSADTGGNGPHDNLQPYQCVNYIIALRGIFPSRS